MKNDVEKIKFSFDDCPIANTKPYDIAKVITRYKLYEMTKNIPGDIAECGVYKGSGLIALANIFKLLDPLCLNKSIYGFDTFEGFASVSEEDQVKGHDPIENGMLNTASVDRASSNAQHGYDVMREIVNRNSYYAAKDFPSVFLVQGDLATCLHSFLQDKPNLRLSLLIADVDIYLPSLEIFKRLVPRVLPGGIVVVDDYSNRKFQGCAKAFNFFFGNMITLKKFEHDPWATYFEVTPEIIKYCEEHRG